MVSVNLKQRRREYAVQAAVECGQTETQLVGGDKAVVCERETRGGSGADVGAASVLAVDERKNEAGVLARNAETAGVTCDVPTKYQEQTIAK